jgi:hypothetical protein
LREPDNFSTFVSSPQNGQLVNICRLEPASIHDNFRHQALAILLIRYPVGFSFFGCDLMFRLAFEIYQQECFDVAAVLPASLQSYRSLVSCDLSVDLSVFSGLEDSRTF